MAQGNDRRRHDDEDHSDRAGSSRRRDDDIETASGSKPGRNNNTQDRQSSTTTFTPAANDDDEQLISALVSKAYHRPNSGNNCLQDWIFYCRNNHPVFAICFQDALHPINKWMRLVLLIGSTVFGLAVTNIIWLIWLRNGSGSNRGTTFSVSAGGFVVQNGTEFVYMDEDSFLSQQTTIEVNTGMLVLWTVGAALHSLFDQTVWYATTCACCCCSCWHDLACAQKARGFVNVVVILAVVLATASATLALVIRASLQEDADLASIRGSGIIGDADDAIELQQVSNSDNWEFLMSYAVELGLAWFVYFFIFELIAFFGLLGCCGRCPIMGGRPAELRQELQRARRSSSRRQQKASSSSRAMDHSESSVRSDSRRQEPRKQPSNRGRDHPPPQRQSSSHPQQQSSYRGSSDNDQRQQSRQPSSRNGSQRSQQQEPRQTSSRTTTNGTRQPSARSSGSTRPSDSTSNRTPRQSSNRNTTYDDGIRIR